MAARIHGEAWADAMSAGIDAEIIAEAALTTGCFAELVKSPGEDSAVAPLERIRDRTLAGEFHPANAASS